MASTYVNDLRLNEMATGDQSGSWGTVTNTNLELIGEAFSYGTEAITTNADTHTTTIADGASDPGRAMFLKYTGALDSACTITIGPNTVSKMWFIENATSGSQNIIISQGSGANVTIAAGQTKAVYSDGAGAGAAFVDAFAALSVGALSGTTGTFSGAVSGASATFDGGVDIDNINIDGTRIALSSGDFTLDVAGDIILDADGADIKLLDNGTQFGTFFKLNNNFYIQSNISDGDIYIYGNDGGSSINALIFDMSDAGTAIFNHDIKLNDAGRLFLGNDSDAQIYNTGSHTYIQNYTNNQDIIFNGVDDGSSITALTLDMSAAGKANFNAGASFQDHVYFGDNDKAVFGASDDLQIYHSSSDNNSYITETGSGSLVIAADELYVQNAARSETKALFTTDGGVKLRYNDVQKFETTSSGITVTGTLDINTNDAAGNTIDIIGEGSTNGAAICTNWATGSAYLDFRLGGLTTASTEMRLYNGGDLHVDGNVIAYSTTISDERLKTDIVKIDSALDKIDQINGYTFTYTADGKKSAGVIAQEVEKVLPSAITESTLPLKMGEDDKTEYKTVQYDQLIGLLVEAVKELKAEVAELKGK